MKLTTQKAYQLLQQGAEALAEVEAAGVRVNTKYLDKTINRVSEKIKEVEERIRKDEVYRTWHKRFGDRTKLGSYTQLKTVLFGSKKEGMLGYKITELTDTKQPKLNKDVMADIDLPIIQDFVQVQNLKKTLSTYLYGIKRELVKIGPFWYVHPIYNLHTAATYRSSCDNPNFQNIPKRNPEMAALIRPCYMPQPGHHMVEIDFSQLEIRIGQAYFNDPVLDKYIRDKTTDMHRDIAMRIFKLTPEEYEKNKDYYKKTIRDSSKNQFVFPEFYGSVYFNCAKDIWKATKRRKFMCGKKTMLEHLAEHGIKELGRCEAGKDPVRGTFEYHLKEEEKDLWQSRFKATTRWRRSWFERYQREGGFSMLTGFRVNGEYSRNEVINYPVQGSAFHCLLWCLIKIQKWLRKHKMRSCIVGEIHDSLILSVHPNEIQDVLNYARKVMTEDLLEEYTWINVPIEIEVDVSEVDRPWSTAEEWVDNDGTWMLAN